MTKENPIDKGLKLLARREAQTFIQLIFGDSCDYELKVIEDTVLNIPEKRADFIYILQKNKQKFGLHIDFQLKPKKVFPKTVFIYNALFTETLNIPVCSVVIYPEKGNYKTFHDHYRVNLLPNLSNRFNFKAIKLWDYYEEIKKGKFIALAPLMVLLVDNPDEIILQQEKELIYTVKDRKKLTDLISVAITVASRRFSREFLYKFFKEEIFMLKEWDIVQKWIKEGKQEGRQEGRQEGEEKGRQEGEEKGRQEGEEKGRQEGLFRGKQEDVMKLLKKKFGKVPAKLGKKIKAVKSVEKLDEILLSILDVGSLKEIEKML